MYTEEEGINTQLLP